MITIMDPTGIIEGLKRLGVTHDRVAELIGIDRTGVTKMFAGKRQMKASEIAPLANLLAKAEQDAGEAHLSRRAALDTEHEAGLVVSYVAVEVLPTFAGMGGGGTGDADEIRALLPRALIEDDLRGRADDFLVINLRGNSMVPDFEHGDQVVIDKRDRNPVQPGPFALWDGDGYVVKNVERRRGKYRVFSSNKDYSEVEYEPEDVQIMGRTVWYARRL